METRQEISGKFLYIDNISPRNKELAKTFPSIRISKNYPLGMAMSEWIYSISVHQHPNDFLKLYNFPGCCGMTLISGFSWGLSKEESYLESFINEVMLDYHLRNPGGGFLATLAMEFYKTNWEEQSSSYAKWHNVLSKLSNGVSLYSKNGNYKNHRIETFLITPKQIAPYMGISFVNNPCKNLRINTDLSERSLQKMGVVQ